MSSKNIGLIERIFKHYLLVGLVVTLVIVPVALYLSNTGVLDKYSLQQDTQNYIAWFGITYGLIISSVLVKLWGQFEAVEQSLADEAGAMSILFNTLQALDAQGNADLLACKKESVDFISLYVNHVIENYKEESENNDIQASGQVLLNNIRREISKAAVLRANSSFVFHLLQQLDKVDFLRQKRLQMAKQKMPDAFWFLTSLTSLVWVVSIFLDGNLIVRLTGVFVVAVLFAVLRDLDNYFDGALVITTSAWKKIG